MANKETRTASDLGFACAAVGNVEVEAKPIEDGLLSPGRVEPEVKCPFRWRRADGPQESISRILPEAVQNIHHLGPLNRRSGLMDVLLLVQQIHN